METDCKEIWTSQKKKQKQKTHFYAPIISHSCEKMCKPLATTVKTVMEEFII